MKEAIKEVAIQHYVTSHFCKNIWVDLYYFWRIVGGQCEPSEALLQHNMKEQRFSFDNTSNFEFVSNLYCYRIWQINFVSV